MLFEAGLLDVGLLENQLRLFVVEAAAAGGWIHFAGKDEPRTEIFPGYLGSATTWVTFNQRSPTLFAAEIAEWSGKLLDKSVEIATPLVATTERASPRQLLESYFARFPDEKIKRLDLCWAAGQHYREWKRWIAGQVRDGSTADLAFRRILTSGKRPGEYKIKPRPPGWQ